MPTLGYPRQSCIVIHAGHPWATIGTKIDSWYPLSPKANDRRPFLSFQISFIKQKNLMKIGFGKNGQKNQQILAIAKKNS